MRRFLLILVFFFIQTQAQAQIIAVDTGGPRCDSLDLETESNKVSDDDPFKGIVVGILADLKFMQIETCVKEQRSLTGEEADFAIAKVEEQRALEIESLKKKRTNVSEQLNRTDLTDFAKSLYERSLREFPRKISETNRKWDEMLTAIRRLRQ